ncbi:MAG: tRNA (adenosine(37)-N6)-threonylcarbamoyltransferase complex dimerization subunit type 1 TsaB, partial [Methylocella sp.]
AGSGAPLLAIEASAAGTDTWIVRENAGLDIVFVAKLGLLADPALTPPRPFYLAVPGAKVPEAAPSQPAAR